jgi:hypothetical protein
LAKNNIDIDYNILKKFFIEAEEFKTEWLKLNRHCDLCDVKLTPENYTDKHQEFHISYCCDKHAEYRTNYKISESREKLGFPLNRNIPSFFD